MNRPGPSVLLLLVLPATMVGSSWSAPPVTETVRRDWYFRESLAAIRDWESILARWEKTSPDAEPAPVFPVPASGETARWPNPIPLTLLPQRDRDLRLRLRTVGGKVEVQRAGQGDRPTWKTVHLGQAVLGYQHPGGGGRDRWYHRYHRRFDRLTRFQPKPAPLLLELDGPLDLKRGRNELAVTLRNVAGRPLKLALRLRFHWPAATRGCGQQTLTLEADATQTVRFPIELHAPGGGLLVLGIEGAGEPFWVPLLTHVEDVAAVLGGIERILADTPDAAAAARLAALRRSAEQWQDAASVKTATPWRTLFEQSSRLRDELLLRRIRFDRLLFVKRKPFTSEQPFMDAHHCYNRPGGGIYRLSPVCPGGKATPVADTLGEGVYRDVCLHWTAKRLLFSFGNGSDRGGDRENYNIYEIGTDGKGLRQLTSSPKNDCEPVYLPDGRIGFTSDRSEYYVMCGNNIHVANLFVMQGDGSNVRQLSFNAFNDFNPSIMPDGRILYSRWEYNERSVTSLHDPFTVNPDGSMMAPYYGNATIRPNVVMFPRPVPGSNKITALFTAHHGQTHGPIGLIDVRRGIDGDQPLTVLTPNVPITGEKAEDSRYGWFSDPAPLSETTYLCSFTPTVLPWLERSWALYVGDRHGNLALVYRDEEISLAAPVPLVPRRPPHVRPWLASEGGAEQTEATLLLADVYIGLPGVRRGTARYLRILEDVPRKAVPEGGVICTSGTPIYTIKRILGTVPIEPDGSAHFVVPADRNVYFAVLDQEHREIQRMRSVVCLKPAERRTCIGCHESRMTAPPNIVARALRRGPSRPVAPPWGTRPLSFLRDVQPLLNSKCVRCHTHDRAVSGVILTGDLTDQFTVGYEELLPYLSVANAVRWDHPDDVYARPPYTYGSSVSRLTKLLSAGHHEVQLTEEEWRRLVNWIDANGVYYDRYETTHTNDRHVFEGAIRKKLEEVYARRCTACHGRGHRRHGNWWLSLNYRDVKLSRALKAPLARSAGGWQRCGQPVFAGTDDPDYKTLLAALTALRERLAQRPRADLLSIRGTAAERQQVELPPPPPPRKPVELDLPKGDSVDLSDLQWESGRSGWTPNNDGLPRRNMDVENRPLRLGSRRYRKGIGTHAPSKIVYRLDGRYARFFAIAGGAEAGGTVVFQVFGDGRRLFDSGTMYGLRGAKKIDVSVAEVGRLRLVVTDAGDGYHADMANWAAARLLRAAEAAKEQSRR